MECSTIDPFLATAFAEEAASRGLAYLQATLGKTPAVAAAGEAPLFVGGESSVKECLWTLFLAMGKPVDVEIITAACAVKLISNLVGMANLAALAEGLRVGRMAGMDTESLLQLLSHTGACSFQMDMRGPWIVHEDFIPCFALSLAHHDLQRVHDMARRWRLETPMLAAARDAFAQAERQGLGEKDCAAVACLDGQ